MSQREINVIKSKQFFPLSFRAASTQLGGVVDEYENARGAGGHCRARSLPQLQIKCPPATTFTTATKSVWGRVCKNGSLDGWESRVCTGLFYKVRLSHHCFLKERYLQLDNLFRKATRQVVDAWLVSHATPAANSNTEISSPTHANTQSCSSRGGSGATTPVR